jgi:molybdopterin/thiamine biosynthesis adenylyltransferase
MSTSRGVTNCDRPFTVVVVGAGGNIGSHLVRHLGRMPAIGRVTLIDRDVYEAANLRSQDITPAAVGKSKAMVQARCLRQVNPALPVQAISAAIEDVPLGALRADVLLACLDSKGARRVVNQAAWRLGIPWIDAGVEPGGLLVRVEAYVPNAEAPCIECGWDDEDYGALATNYPCHGTTEAPVTAAPSCLGALAASLQAIECLKLLSGKPHQVAIARQILIDGAHHRHYATRLIRNPRCRFDHQIWNIASAPRVWRSMTIGQILKLEGSTDGGKGTAAMTVDGKAFVRALVCTQCGTVKRTLRLEGRLWPSECRCAACGGERAPVGFEMVAQLDCKALGMKLLSRSLRAVGIKTGDVITITSRSDEDQHFVIDDAQL